MFFYNLRGEPSAPMAMAMAHSPPLRWAHRHKPSWFPRPRSRQSCPLGETTSRRPRTRRGMGDLRHRKCVWNMGEKCMGHGSEIKEMMGCFLCSGHVQGLFVHLSASAIFDRYHSSECKRLPSCRISRLENCQDSYSYGFLWDCQGVPPASISFEQDGTQNGRKFLHVSTLHNGTSRCSCHR